jgi:hypothetical protein
MVSFQLAPRRATQEMLCRTGGIAGCRNWAEADQQACERTDNAGMSMSALRCCTVAFLPYTAAQPTTSFRKTLPKIAGSSTLLSITCGSQKMSIKRVVFVTDIG